ncbi:hypothetical protein [Vibrio cyclitrophicus]|nr:hypothetical protein [Vibrio cyclitrophicus]
MDIDNFNATPTAPSKGTTGEWLKLHYAESIYRKNYLQLKGIL